MDQPKEKIANLFYCFECIFKFAFLTLALLSFNNLFAGSFALKIFSLFVALFGSVIVFYRLLNVKKYIKFYAFPLLILFSLSYTVSSLVNIKYGIVENIQALVWMIFHFSILYTSDTTRPADKEQKVFWGLLKYFLFYIAISNIVSIAMLITGFGRTFFNSFNGNLMGFIWGRLWGIYTDPNTASILCVASIFISLYFLFKTTHKWNKVLMILNILLSLCYISFSDSRTGLVCFVFSLFVCSYIFFKNTSKIKLKTCLKQLTAIACAFIIATSGLMSINGIKSGYNALIRISSDSDSSSLKDDNESSKENITDSSVESTTSSSAESTTSSSPESTTNSSLESTTETPSDNTVGRTGNELDGDISNRRFSLWKSGIEIWKKSPVLGTSHRNLISFALDKTPDTYLVNNDRAGYFDTTHNSYIDILISQGIVGAVIFAIIFILIIVLIFKKMIFTNNYSYCTAENLLLVGLLLAFASSAAFILEIVYINSAGAFIFWLSLGRLVKKLKENNNG